MSGTRTGLELWDQPTAPAGARPQPQGVLGSINLELWFGGPYRRSTARIQPPYVAAEPVVVALSCEAGDFRTDWYPAPLEGVALSEIRAHQFTGCTAGRPS